MLEAVPLFVRGCIVETVVGTQINDLFSARQELGHCRCTCAMRKAAKHTVGPLRDLAWREVFESQIEPPGERGMHVAHMTRFGLPRGERGDLHLRMAQQDADQL